MVLVVPNIHIIYIVFYKQSFEYTNNEQNGFLWMPIKNGKSLPNNKLYESNNW